MARSSTSLRSAASGRTAKASVRLSDGLPSRPNDQPARASSTVKTAAFHSHGGSTSGWQKAAAPGRRLLLLSKEKLEDGGSVIIAVGVAPVTTAVLPVATMAIPVSATVMTSLHTIMPAIIPPVAIVAIIMTSHTVLTIVMASLPTRLIIVAVTVLSELHVRRYLLPRWRYRDRRGRCERRQADNHRYGGGAQS